MKAFLFLSLAILLSNFQARAALCTANLIGGNWNNAGTWSCGRVPACGDDIFIPFGSIVTVSANVNMSACGSPVNIFVGGELLFGSNRSISLPAGSCLGFFLLGTLVPSLNVFSTNTVLIGGVTEWSGTLLTLPVIGPAGIGCSAPLPVQLTGFDLENKPKEVVLSWMSQGERNNDFYRLEVSSNGEYWQELAIIDGAGTTAETAAYSYTDKNPFTGEAYYRLSQTDFNGQTQILQSLSNTFYGGDYLVYPSLVKELVYVKGPEIENSRVSIVNNLGEEIWLEGIVEGDKMRFNLAGLPDGNYFVKAQNQNVSTVKRIVLIH
ncbi:MAG: domain containing protein [Crocinitomicaceae bacterium]|jgi:hypothetical protein|nr:domain containing protein [Crocinitomicaceae bacterium]